MGCCGVAEQRLTCEEVLAQSRRAAIFAVVEVLRGGGALEVLDGQALAQDVRLQVRTGAELPATNTQTHTRFVPGRMAGSERAPHGPQGLCNSRRKQSFSSVSL